MTYPVSNLTSDSTDDAIRNAILLSIKQCTAKKSGDHTWCATKIWSIAREKTGRSLEENELWVVAQGLSCK